MVAAAPDGQVIARTFHKFGHRLPIQKSRGRLITSTESNCVYLCHYPKIIGMTALPCKRRFEHPQKPRSRCGLPADSTGYCTFHSLASPPNFLETLQEEVAKTDHWLEGANLSRRLDRVDLRGAKLPKANFEGSHLTAINLQGALLERSNFRGAQLDGVVFEESNLRQAIFDRAQVGRCGSAPTDFRGANLGGASFAGSIIHSARLFRAYFPEPTPVGALLQTPCFEMEEGLWDEASTVLSELGRRASGDWDFEFAERAAFLAMACRHKQAIGADPTKASNWYQEWVASTVASGISGWAWLANRLIWGYGLRPVRVVWTGMLVVAIFGIVIFPFVNVACPPMGCSGIRVVDTLIFSLNTFIGLT